MKISKKLPRLAALAVFLMALTFAILPAAQAATALKVYNSTNSEVEVWWNCENPFANNITVHDGNHVLPVRVPSNFTRAEKGVFNLPAGATATITRNSGGSTMSGTITFDCIPVCPCGGSGQPPCPVLPAGFRLPERLVNGVNQAEFTLNPPSNFESVDISCVNGANSRILMELVGGSPVWQNPATHQPVSKIVNRMVDVAARRDENCAEVGVFPFNASDCIQTPLPPCGQPICFHAVRDCQLDRQGSGGTVTIVIAGFDAL